ncbi:TonB-dependent receptor [Salegentibacter maritimus]|uniref:TonB-dependent receptor n=1 Tax=Salegentibacter maritimus TaxID=2794347 RepID=UPI0018E43D2F|nr:TonB-dependent receptor [Salegentibacter maritimus]MBI6117451.1 TonB-dependent receptor [Salegentibacter maritimus]
MKQLQFVLLLFTIFPTITFSQQLKLEGRVVNEQDEALLGAHIHINNRFVLAGENGSYRIGALKEGEHRINVSYIGFRTLDTLISLAEDTVVNFKLKEDAAALEEVFINSHARRRSSENIEKVNKKYLQEQFSGSLATSLERLPGVNASEIGAGASKPIIRGLGFNRVAVTENGIKQEGQQWGADHGLEIDAFSVEDIEIIKGVGAIEHGSDAIGGVIKIINDRVPGEGLSGEVIGLTKSVNNTLTASTNLALRNKRFFYKIKATGSEFGDYSVPTDTIVYLNRNVPIFNNRLKNTAGKEVNLYGQVGYLGEHYKGSLSISNVYFKSGFFPGAHGIPSTNRVQDDGDQRNIEYPFQRVNHLKLINKNEWFFHNFKLEAILGFQNNHRQEWSRFHTHYTGQLAPAVNPDLELNFDLNTYDAQVKFTKDFIENHTTSIGVQTQLQDNTISGYNFLLPEYARVNQGIYATHSYQVSKNINLNAGARLDLSKIKIESFYDSNLYEYLIGNGSTTTTATDYATRSEQTTRNFSNVNVMAGALFNFHKNWDFSVNTGTSFRLPTAIELGANGIHHGSFRHERGDSNLDPEKGYVLDTKLNYRKNDLKASLSPYLYYFENYIFLNPSGRFSILPHAGQVYQFTQSEALLTGVELDFYTVFAEKWHTQFTFEYLYNRQVTSDKSRNFPLPFTPPVNGFLEIGYDFSHKSKTFKNTEIFANSSFAFQQERVAQNEEITPGYQVFGGGLRTNIQIANFKAAINLQASNVFNTKYFNHTNFYRALEIPEMGRNIQLMVKIPIK